MDSIVHGVMKSRTRLSDFHFRGSFLPGLLRNLHTVLHSGCLHSLVYIPTNKEELPLCSFSNLIFLIT